jgi:hypothetical protein
MDFISTGASGGRGASLRHSSLSRAAAPQLGEKPSCAAALSVLKPIRWSSRVEADQVELAREVVPVGVCPSSAARGVDPRREELAVLRGSLDQSMRLTCPAQRSFR